MNDKTDTFQYTYSAKQQDEIQKIRKKYLPQEEDKMEQLRRLDKSTNRKGTAVFNSCRCDRLSAFRHRYELYDGLDGTAVYTWHCRRRDRYCSNHCSIPYL